MRYQYYKLTYFLPLISLLGLLFIFFTTDPLTAGPAGMLLVFFLLYVFFASIFFIILHIGVTLVSKLSIRLKMVRDKEWGLGVKKSYYIASIFAFGPVLLLAMQSVGQLQVRDILLTAAFLAIAIFYVLKRS